MTTTVAPGSVVVGIDGSSYSDAAVAWAADYAVAHHAPLCLLHAAGDLGDNLIPFKVDAREMLAKASKPITDRARELVAERAPELSVTVEAPFADARAALLDVHGAAMIVLGTRGRGPLATRLLGSVSQAVVTRASCPVTVVRPSEGRDDTDLAPVVVGVDLDGSAQPALEVAFELASMTNRALDAMHAWTAHDTFIDAASYNQRLEVMEAHERGFAEAMSGFAEKYPDVVVTPVMVDDHPTAALVHASETAAHVVLGSRERSRMTRSFGSVSRAVVEHAHCPVTVVHPVPTHQDGEKS
jgi:nucleotide-binding universal stress UspA family protein